MNARRLLAGLLLLVTTAACFDERIVAPDDLIPPLLAIDRPTVQLFRFARGRKVEADTVRITNNGQGPLGVVEQVGGVDYITTARTGWLDATIVNLGNDEALLVLVPTYAEDEQAAAVVAEVILKGQGSTDLKRVQVITRTLRGASFEFSVSPLAFAAVPGDPAATQRLTVRNGGNGTLQINPPTVRFKGNTADWLSLQPVGGSNTAPEYEIRVEPGTLGGGLFEAFLHFESLPTEETRAKPDSVSVQLNIGQPTLRVSTSNLAFTVIRGAEDPPAQAVLLSNSGEGAFSALGVLEVGEVTYTSGTAGWLTLTRSAEQISVSAATSGLATGAYEATFPVVSTNGGTRTVQVTLSVEAPVLTPSSRSISFGMVAGASNLPAAQVVAINNTGSGTLESLGTLSLGPLTPASPWLMTGLAGNEITLTPTAAASSLTSGDYTTLLPVHSLYGGTDTLFVTLSVSRGLDPPILALSAAQVEFSGISGGSSPPPQDVQISNAGGGTLGTVTLGAITYPGTAGWLTASLSGNAITLTATTGALPDGTHLATVPVSSANGGSANIDVAFAIGLPVLTGSATSASFSATEGGGNPSDQTITFTNTGPGTFASLGAVSVGAVTYSGTGGWLTPAFAVDVLTLSVATGALPAGTYGATVPVNSAQGGTVSVDVTFTVTRTTDAADLVVSPATVRMDAVSGGSNPPAETVLLTNGGGGTLGALGVSGITYGGVPSGWLSAGLAGNTVTLNATTGTLGSGTYSATVGITSANGGNEDVGVSFVVGAPTLTLSSASASFSGDVGGTASPGSASIGISNTGSGGFASLGAISLGVVTYGGAGAGWLTAGLSGGNTSVDLSAAIGGVGVGTYTASLPVNSAAGGSGSIGVTLTVTPQPAAPSLVLSATGATYYAVEGGGDPASQAISISNGGGGGIAALGALSLGTITYGAGTGWLSAGLAGTTVTLSPTTGTLTAAGGPYTATVPVVSAGGGSVDISVTFNVSAAGAPTDLAVSPSAVRMDAVAGGASPAAQGVLLYNSGDGALGALSVVGVTYTSGAGWLSAVLGGSTVTLTANSAGLSAGTYEADVEVGSVNGGNETVHVTLEVAGPSLTLSSTSVSFNGEEGGVGSPATVSVALSNTGAGDFSSLGAITLGGTTYGGASGWLTAALAGGNTQVDLSVTIGMLGVGTHSATVPVNSAGGGSGSIGVTLSVSRTSDAPSLALSASGVDFTALLGGASPNSKTVSLSNSGGGTVGDLGTLGIGTITYGGGGTGWLATSALAGSTLTLSPVTGALNAGTHTATVPVTSQFGGNASVSVTVVVASPVLTASTLGLSFTGLVGGAAPGIQNVTFSNTGAGTYGDLGSVTVGAISYGAGAAGWLVQPAGGAGVVGGSQAFSVNQAGIAAGTYTATVPVASQFGGSQSILVTLSVVRETDPPDLVLSATTQRFDALVGGLDPLPQTVVASNSGGGSLGAISVAPPVYGMGATGWLTASVAGNTITTRARTGSLAQGTYTASLTVSSGGGSEVISITFVVGTSRLTLSPRALSFSDTLRGTGPEAGLVAIANTGGGSYTNLGGITLAPTVYLDGATGWLEATLSAPDSVRVRAVTGELPSRPSPYQARVPVVSTLGGMDTIQVSFNVLPGTSPANLALSLDSMTFAGILGAGTPAAQTVTGFNSGGGSLGALTVGGIEYLIGAQGWLSGSVSGLTITLQTSVAGVAGGTHRARVTISSENGGNETVEVALALAPPVLGLSSQTVTFSDTVGSPDTLQTQVFISNIGAGNRASLGRITLGNIVYSQGDPGWLVTTPGPGEEVGGFVVGLRGSASDLPQGSSVALVPVESEWGGNATVAVTFAAREPDRSFDLPTIELVKDSLINGNTVKVPLAGDSVVVGPVNPGSSELGIRVGVRNGSQTRVSLSGLRVGTPSYPEMQAGGWITGAFLDRTTATFDQVAELFVVVVPQGLASGRYEGRLVVSSESAALEEVAPRVLRVILIVN